MDAWLPKLVLCLRDYSKRDFLTDLLAGITVGLLALLRLRNMTALDATGLHEIENLAAKLHESGRTLILCGAREQPATLIHQAKFEEHVGKENICEHVEDALDRARQLHSETHLAAGA